MSHPLPLLAMLVCLVEVGHHVELLLFGKRFKGSWSSSTLTTKHETATEKGKKQNLIFLHVPGRPFEKNRTSLKKTQNTWTVLLLHQTLPASCPRPPWMSSCSVCPVELNFSRAPSPKSFSACKASMSPASGVEALEAV